MKLLCVSRYRGTVDPRTDAQGEFTAGEVIDCDDVVGEFLLRVSPGVFVANKKAKVEEETPVADVPKVDRRQRGGRVRG